MPQTGPGHDALVADLREIRRRGLFGRRDLDAPALAAAASLAGSDRIVGGGSARTAVEALLRTAVGRLGDDDLGLAAQYLFGLRQGTMSWSSSRRREKAAEVFERSAETFRKEREKDLLDRLAIEIRALCSYDPRVPGQGSPPDDPAHAAAGPGTTTSGAPVVRAGAVGGIREQVDRALRHLVPRVDDPALGEHTYGPFAVAAGSAELWVRIGNVMRIRSVDIVVSSENVFLQPAKTYSPTLSGSVRRAAMCQDADGRPVDVVALELARWMADRYPDGPAPLGSVIRTSPGGLERYGVRCILHAAVAVPRPGTNSYDTTRDALQTAVAGVFELAKAERQQARSEGAPEPRTISLPLFGAGKGGLTPEQSFGWTWPALLDEVETDPTWCVRLTVRSARSALAVLHGLSLAFDGGDPDLWEP